MAQAQPTPTLHPSHFLTGWSHFHNRSLDTHPALSTALPKQLETICHLLHQHTTITLFPQHKPATPAVSPSPAFNHAGQDQAPGRAFAYSEPRKQENRAISPSVCLFVIEEQPNLTGPGSFTSSSRPSACFGYNQSRCRAPGQESCCTALLKYRAHLHTGPVRSTKARGAHLKPPSTILRLGPEQGWTQAGEARS